MTFRDGINIGAVEKAVVHAIERLVSHVVRQCFLPTSRGRAGCRSARTVIKDASQRLAPDRRVIDIKQPLLHLNAIAGKSNDTFHVVDRLVFRNAKHDDITGRRFGGKYSSRRQRGRKWQRKAAIAISRLRNENIVADKQRRTHGGRRNIEGLIEKTAKEERNRKPQNKIEHISQYRPPEPEML